MLLETFKSIRVIESPAKKNSKLFTKKIPSILIPLYIEYYPDLKKKIQIKNENKKHIFHSSGELVEHRTPCNFCTFVCPSLKSFCIIYIAHNLVFT
jgi:hypothetical protein